MAVKPRIAIVGAGNFGTALALALHQKAYPVDAVLARRREKSRSQARGLARRIGSRVVLNARLTNAGVFWFCVPDREIARAAASLADTMNWRGKIALHSSGALTSDELGALRQKGASVASVHPLMTFVRGSRRPLSGVSFAIEGDPVALRLARAIVRSLGGEPYAIEKAEKIAYHAWGTFASPLMTALLATTERVAAVAGVPARAARRRMLPMLLQTVANYGSFGPAAGFSGPIVRGDAETVRRHLEVLRTEPIPRRVYIALAQAALEYLPAKNKAELQRILDYEGSDA